MKTENVVLVGFINRTLFQQQSHFAVIGKVEFNINAVEGDSLTVDAARLELD